jgi:hypothetical protein
MDDAVAYLLKLTFVALPVMGFLFFIMRVIRGVFANQAVLLSYPFY